MIFVCLDVSDALTAREVCRAFAAGISGSTKVQLTMCYRADAKSSWRSNFDGMWSAQFCGVASNFSCWISDRRIFYNPSFPDTNASIEACLRMSPGRAFADDTGGVFPNVPRKYRTMLICQPPITEKSTTASCCAPIDTSYALDLENQDAYPQPPLPLVVKSTTGLTFDNLLQAAKQLYMDHQSCPYTAELLHDCKGRVHLDIVFKGQLQLDDEDPAFCAEKADLVHWSHRVSRSRSEDDRRRRFNDWRRRTTKSTNVEAYYGSKKQGSFNGEPNSLQIS